MWGPLFEHYHCEESIVTLETGEARWGIDIGWPNYGVKKTSFLLHQRLVNGASDVFSRLAGFLFLTCRIEQDHCLVNSLISELDNFFYFIPHCCSGVAFKGNEKFNLIFRILAVNKSCQPAKTWPKKLSSDSPSVIASIEWELCNKNSLLLKAFNLSYVVFEIFLLFFFFLNYPCGVSLVVQGF